MNSVFLLLATIFSSIFYVDLKTPQHKYSFILEISMFSTQKPYVSALRNVHFTDEKHTALVWET